MNSHEDFFFNIKCNSPVSNFEYHIENHNFEFNKRRKTRKQHNENKCIRTDFLILVNSISSIIAKDIT